jgi:hypothetical protein
MLIVRTFGFIFLVLFAHPSHASFQEAKSRFSALYASYETVAKALAQERSATTAGVLALIEAKKVERENCPSLQCAKDLDQVILDLNQTYSQTMRDFDDRMIKLGEPLAAEGKELALNAYYSELALILQNEIGDEKIKILSSSLVSTCDLMDHPVRMPDPSDSTKQISYKVKLFTGEVCKTAIIEFRKPGKNQSEFGRVYFTLVIGDNIVSRLYTPTYLNHLFSKSRDEFLGYPTGLRKEAYLQSLETPCSLGTLGSGYDHQLGMSVLYASGAWVAYGSRLEK